jgi:regulator of protease activity HflC (stomatin/prohibitin superfamily)
VSQIIHIPRASAAKVIARFGSVENLVTQILEPLIGNYFRNAAQSFGAIEFITKRGEQQKLAKEKIEAALKTYDIVAVDTLIGDIVPPTALMDIISKKELADRQTETYKSEETAENARQSLLRAKALADKQPEIVAAEQAVVIAGSNAEAKIKTAEGDAKSTTLGAAANAEKIKVEGEAEAGVAEKKTKAIGQDNYAAIEVARSFANSNQPIVPEIQVTGADGGGTNSLVNLAVVDALSNRRKAKAEVSPKKEEAAPEVKVSPETKTEKEEKKVSSETKTEEKKK